MLTMLQPAIWLVIFIVGLPQLSETVYTPALPEIANALRVPEAQVEYTLTIYLFAFALGTLFWGKLSDSYGRKPCILAGIFIFLLGCVGCYLSSSIELLLLSRFVQAFGGSIGSVLGQAICRDAFNGPALSRAYASVGMALALYPAIGPVIGGFIAQHLGWSFIFLFLIVVSVLLAILVSLFLPETHHKDKRNPVSILEVGTSLIRNGKVIAYGLLVAGCNGIMFSYFAEGSFYLIDLLHWSPSQYGLSFIAIAASTMMGGFFVKHLQQKHSSDYILGAGLWVMLAGAAMSSLVIGSTLWFSVPHWTLSLITILAQMTIMFGSCIVTSTALANALVEYKWCIGTASSLFGFSYYCLISLLSFAMGILHNGTLYPMPFYFLGITLVMMLVRCSLLRK